MAMRDPRFAAGLIVALCILPAPALARGATTFLCSPILGSYPPETYVVDWEAKSVTINSSGSDYKCQNVFRDGVYGVLSQNIGPCPMADYTSKIYQSVQITTDQIKITATNDGGKEVSVSINLSSGIVSTPADRSAEQCHAEHP